MRTLTALRGRLMGNAANELQTRIAWCHLQRSMAVTREDAEGWQAEEAGLSDALHGLDRTEHWNNFSPTRVRRYQVGLRDGLALRAVMRLRHSSNRLREAAEGLSLVTLRNRPATQNPRQAFPPDISRRRDDDELPAMRRTIG